MEQQPTAPKFGKDLYRLGILIFLAIVTILGAALVSRIMGM